MAAKTTGASGPNHQAFSNAASAPCNPREAVTSLWFVAFESLGEAIANNARKGDQLIIQAQIRANNWTDKEGEKQYDYSFVVQNFRFGAPGRAKREEMAARRDEKELGALAAEV